jgi:hypothetical protein
MVRTTWFTAVAAMGALLPLTAAGAAAKPAAPRPLCQQISDGSGDAPIGGANNKVGQPQYASLDITSVDVATGPRRLAGVIRVKTLSPDPSLPAGATYEVRFTAGDRTYHLWYRIFLGGRTEFTFSTDKSGPGQFTPIDGAVDPTTASITLYLPRTAVPALKLKRARLTAIEGHTAVGENIDRTPATSESRGGSSADDAVRAGYSYLDQTPTCVKGT